MTSSHQAVLVTHHDIAWREYGSPSETGALIAAGPILVPPTMDVGQRIARKVRGLKRRHIADGATYVQNKPGNNMATFFL
jgi:hypothetical protein